MQNEKATEQSVLAKRTAQSADKKSLSLIKDKALRKKLRNRQSALAARERKKARMLMLERTIRECELKREKLIQENQMYRRIEHLMQMKKRSFANFNARQFGPPQKILDNQIYGLENRNLSNGKSVSRENVSGNHAMSMIAPPNRHNSVDYVSLGFAGSSDENRQSNYSISRRNSTEVLVKSCALDTSGQPSNNRRASLPCSISSLMPNGLDQSSSHTLVTENSSPAPFMPHSHTEVAEFPGNKQCLRQPSPLSYYQPVRSAEEHFYVSPEIQVNNTDDVFSPNIPNDSNAERQRRMQESEARTTSEGSSSSMNIIYGLSDDTAVHYGEYRHSCYNYSPHHYADRKFAEVCHQYCTDKRYTQPRSKEEVTSHHHSAMSSIIPEDGHVNQEGGAFKEYGRILQWLLDDSE